MTTAAVAAAAALADVDADVLGVFDAGTGRGIATDRTDEEDPEGSVISVAFGGIFNKLNNDVLLGDLSFSCIGCASLALAVALALVLAVATDTGITLICFLTVISTTCDVPLVTTVSLLCSHIVVVVVPLVRD